MIKKIIILGLISTCPCSELLSQGSILKNSVPQDLHKHTLLVDRFKPLDPNEDYFKSGEVNTNKEQRYLKKHNKNISKNNLKLDKIFTKYYGHNYVLSNHESSLDSTKYPYLFSRTLILASKVNPRKKKQGFFSFSHNINNRRTNKSMRDINLYSRKYWHNLKIIIQEMNDYLEGRD